MAANKDYWAARALQREAEAYARGAELSARLYDAYQTALRDLRRQINDFYMRYARENRLTYAEAVKALNRAEAREWKATLGEWVERINAETDQEIKARLKAELDALSYRSRMDRLEALCGQMEMTLDELYVRCMRETSEGCGEAYLESYYKKSFDIQQRAGRIWEVAGIDSGMAEDVLSYPWSGANFSDRLWRNKAALLFNLRQDLTQGLIKGTGIAPLSKSLSEQMAQSYKAAERVVRTELNHFHNEADRAAYQAAGIEWYEFMATLDSRTCAVCGALDGKRFKVSEAQTGVNYPPMHPNDRCTTVEYDPEEAEDWAAAGEKMPERMTYEEWAGRQAQGDEAELPDGLRRLAKSASTGKRVVGFDKLPEALQRDFREGLAKAAPEAKTVLRREYRRADYRIGAKNGSYYSGGAGKDIITLGINAESSTLAHELFHKLDRDHGISQGLSAALTQDYVALNVVSGGDIRAYLAAHYPEAFVQKHVTSKLRMKPEYRGIADILNGLSGGKETYGYKHSIDYWSSSGTLEAEAWAQFGRIQFGNDPEVLKMLSEVFPNFAKDAMLALKGLI